MEIFSYSTALYKFESYEVLLNENFGNEKRQITVIKFRIRQTLLYYYQVYEAIPYVVWGPHTQGITKQRTIKGSVVHDLLYTEQMIMEK